jgi:hypothetical protein
MTRRLIGIIAAVTSCALGAGVLWTLLVPDWIEQITGLDPDQGTGEFEWMLIVVMGFIAVVVLFMGRFAWRRARREVRNVG